MDAATARALSAYIKLSQPQKGEFVREINEYIDGTIEKKVALSRAVEVVMGPLGGICSYCGK